MTKADLVDYVKDNSALPANKSKELVDGMFDFIADNLMKGDEFVIYGFGTFRPSVIAAGKKRNPYSGEFFDSPERKTFRFKVSKKLRDEFQK